MFKKATRKQTKARVAIHGPSGSGKTRQGLALARLLADAPNRVAVIDTENQSASLYQGLDGNDFDVIELEAPFTVKKYVDAIAFAVNCGRYDALFIDSLSHAWSAEGGLLDQKDSVVAGSNNKNEWAAWATLTPMQNKLQSALTHCSLHLICSMRTQTDWMIGINNKPVRVGLKPTQRAGIEYEFSVFGAFDMERGFTVEKSRVFTLETRRYKLEEFNVEVALNIREFHATGEMPIPADAPRFGARWANEEWRGKPMMLAPPEVIQLYIDQTSLAYARDLTTVQRGSLDMTIGNARAALAAKLPARSSTDDLDEPPATDDEPLPDAGDPWDDVDVNY